MFQGMKCVVHGADHIKNQMVCQDAAAYQCGKNYGIAVVADGHGGAKYIRSDVGSKKATECAVATVSSYMEDYDRFAAEIRRNPDYILRHMGEQFLARWTQAVEDYNDENPLTEEEKLKLEKIKGNEENFYSFYGSTVLVAVMGEDFHFGFLIGDGGFAVVEGNGEVKIPIEDKNSRANYTSSICSRNAIDALTWFFAEGRPMAMCVSTDGLIKSFDSEKDFKDYHVLLATMLSDMEKCQVSLEKNLTKRTVSGSGDDISISVAFDQESIIEKREMLVSIIEKNRAEKKAQEEAIRLERIKRAKEQERRRLEEERKRQEEERRRQEEERRRQQDQMRLEEERIKRQEQKLLYLEKVRRQEQKRLEDSKRRISQLNAEKERGQQEQQAMQEKRRMDFSVLEERIKRIGNHLETGKRLFDKFTLDEKRVPDEPASPEDKRTLVERFADSMEEPSGIRKMEEDRGVFRFMPDEAAEEMPKGPLKNGQENDE